MAVMIENMPMPKGCGQCWLTYMDYDEDDCPVDVCALTNKRVWNDFDNRADDCPLIEV